MYVLVYNSAHGVSKLLLLQLRLKYYLGPSGRIKSKRVLTYTFKYKAWYDGKNETFMVRAEFQSVSLNNLFNNTSKPQLPHV